MIQDKREHKEITMSRAGPSETPAKQEIKPRQNERTFNKEPQDN